MAKEISIVFVYDTQRCQKEEDDPQDAVIYFYPSWVSEQQRLALCGQLMGAMHFSVSMFSCPSILTLQNGKFALRRIGQYILAVGSDSPTPDWVLKHQTETLHQLIQFYHKDFDSILNQALNDGSSFVEKLSAIFDFYLPIAQQAGEMFDNIPTVILPKSASNVFLEAFHILHCCQEKKGVLGGTVLYQNKVIATQLSPDTTKRLVFTDPFNKTGPAENVSTSFHLPVGAHLLHVFISSHEFKKLRQSAVCARESFENVTKVRLNQMKGTSMKIVPPKELSLGSKKESSRIPTVLEEGEGEAEGADQVDGSSLCKASYVKPKTNNVESTVRNLTNRTDSVARHPSGSCTPMTPMKDVNKVLHLQALSICKGSDETDSSVQEKTSKQKETSKSVSRVIKNIEKKTKKLNKSDFLVNYWGSEVRSLSLDDFREKQLTSNRIPLRYYSFGLPKLTRGACGGSKNGSPVHEPVSRRKHSFYNTITDPWYPVFRCDGLAVSKSLFDQYLEQHYTWLNSESKVKSCRGTPDGVSRRHSSPQEFKTFASVIPETSSAKHKVQEVNVSAKEVLPMGSAKREVYRRSLSLPLKTLAINGESDFMQAKDKLPAITPQGESALYQGMVINQITPMTPDISLLQFTNRLPGFNSTASTPCETKLLCEVSNILSGGANKLDDYASRRQQTKTNQRDPSVSASEKKPNSKDNSSMSDEEAVLQQATLYIYGQQNMALLLLVEDVEAKDPELIHSLWETCMSSLPHLESRTRQCLEHLPNTEQCDMYSYLCFDSSWDTLQSGGSWEPLQLDVVHHLHHNFVTSPGLTEIVVRSDEHIIYAYQCCRTEVFYQQNTGNKIGIPTPSDLMGLVSLKARRRLERDHGIVLL